ncbi:hypothetical protein ISX56_35420, partial [Serratia ureilytica]|nr:hypothetical protein [Serratia ureilytica]
MDAIAVMFPKDWEGDAHSETFKLAEIPQENIQHELDRMKLATLDDLLAEIGL